MHQQPAFPSDLSHDPVGRVVRPYLLPVNVGKSVVRQSLVDRLLDDISRLAHLPGTQFGDDGAGLLLGDVSAFLRMDGLEHMADFPNLGHWNVAEDVPVKMHHAPLPARLG